jgi:hypothetical protein
LIFDSAFPKRRKSMNLTIEQVSKLTKLSVPTLFAYASRKKLGKRLGNKRFFTQADVQLILKDSRKSPTSKKAKTPIKKATIRKVPSKSKPIAAPKPTAANSERTTPVVKSQKPSFWTRLFRGRKRPKKVSLMDAKTTKQA